MMAGWSEQHLVEVFLPIPAEGGEGRELFEDLKARLVAQHGGVTAYAQAPAEGLWAEKGGVARDRIVVLEVLVDVLDLQAWAALKTELEGRLHQQEILIRATPVKRLTD